MQLTFLFDFIKASADDTGSHIGSRDIWTGQAQGISVFGFLYSEWSDHGNRPFTHGSLNKAYTCLAVSHVTHAHSHTAPKAGANNGESACRVKLHYRSVRVQSARAAALSVPTLDDRILATWGPVEWQCLSRLTLL